MLSGEGKMRLEREIRSRIKTAFGKGPESIEISFGEKTIVVVIEGFLTKVEKLRMDEIDGMDEIRSFRYAEMKRGMEKIIKSEAFIEALSDKAYIDVHADEDSACFVVFTKE